MRFASGWPNGTTCASSTCQYPAHLEIRIMTFLVSSLLSNIHRSSIAVCHSSTHKLWSVLI